MLVRYFMTPAVRTFETTETYREVWRCFQKEGLRRAPIVHEHRVVGMITDRDLVRMLPHRIGELERLASTTTYERPIGDGPRRQVISVEPNDHLETAARLLLENKIGGMPVIYKGHLKGIITESDLFRVFVRLKHSSGATRLTFHWPARLGESELPAQIAVETGVHLHEYFSHPSPAGGEMIAIRAFGTNLDDFVARLIGAGYLLIDRADPEDLASVPG
ncbi:MAG: CBS domain-containing protein [Planctomycetes bacterium]|nr:CBS domain-containing protein [Planctomycetota bacterium]